MAAESRLTIVHRVCAWCRKEFGLDTWSGRVDVEITTWGICSRCLRQESARERAARKEERRRTAPPNPPSKHGRLTRSRANFAPAASHAMPSLPCIPEVRYARSHFLVSILSLLKRPVQAARRPVDWPAHRGGPQAPGRGVVAAPLARRDALALIRH